MAVEIVEEEAIEAMEKLEKGGEVGVSEEELGDEGEEDMPWDSSYSAFKFSPSAVDANCSADLIWNKIELAERFLVSAMYQDAASTATTILQTLSCLMHLSDHEESCGSDREDITEDAEVGKSEHEEMLECAGMVLLQSYRAIGRVGEFFDSLKALNVGVAEWPPFLVEIGACLQVADGAFPAARAALEEFLAFRSMCLLEEAYAEIVELYVIKVLAEGLQETEHALDWVKRASLTQDRRSVLLKKIQLQIEQAKFAEVVLKPIAESTSSLNSGTPTAVLESIHIKEPVKDMETEESSDPRCQLNTCKAADDSSISSKSMALLKKLNVSEGFFSLKTLLELAFARVSAATSAWHPLSSEHLEGNVLRFGALVALFFFLRHFPTWRRFIGKAINSFGVGIRDFWQLAFSVQINPLAAVNPISAAYG
ncbi:protein APEM9 [Physcomitrium patens]|uniref:Uncharacterized protein n=1 Tax=Physcomitrium patens TaxID=3218 RepID=A0A2K1K241_PHYPA|nr:protein APEM9-like [Physcomitrium patens]PNR47845.1 hypothetical protein PHYPA_012318 [Physcomitrium patens]|eukprot:XP_024385322.1 protein APEM9-like [Physcomitrella patens]